VNPTLLAAQNLGNRINRSADAARDFKAAVARVVMNPNNGPSGLPARSTPEKLGAR